MVRALLDGSKTQTRRVCKPAETAGLSRVIGIQNPRDFGQRPLEVRGSGWFGDEDGDVQFCSPYGQPGDCLWVRETWAPNAGTAGGFLYRADHGGADSYHAADLRAGQWTHTVDRWKPSIHMPRRASRILLEITSVRVERLRDISADDVRAEGVLWDAMGWMDYEHDDGRRKSSSRQSYQTLWESINGAGSWDANPWVWVVEFKQEAA
jgi:hypothetical protein